MGLIMFFLIWILAPFAELAGIIILAEKNRQYKKKIENLENVLYHRQRQWQPSAPLAEPSKGAPVPQPIMPAGPAGGPAVQVSPPVMPMDPANGQPVQQPQPIMPTGLTGGPAVQVSPPVMPMGPANRQPVQIRQPAIPVSAAGQTEKPAFHANTMGMLALIAGIVFIVLAGLIFATTTWKIMPDFCKVLLVGFFAMVLFGASFAAEKKLHIHKTGNGLYVLGSIFLFLTVFAACYFRFLGSAFVLYGINRYRVLWLGSVVTVSVWFMGLRRFYDRVFTYACLSGLSVSVMFLALSFDPDFCEFSCIMMFYAFFLLLLECVLSHMGNGRQDREPGDQTSVAKAQTPDGGNIPAKGNSAAGGSGITWTLAGRMLLREMTLFVPFHFWIAAFFCAGNGLREIMYGAERSVFTLSALSAAIVGIAVLCVRKKRPSCQWSFVLSMEYFLHYVLILWLFPGHELYAFLLAEIFAVLWFIMGKRQRAGILTGGSAVMITCTAAACLDGFIVVLWTHLHNEISGIIAGEQLAASAAVLLFAGILYIWSRRYSFVKNLAAVVCLYLTVTTWHLAQLFLSACPDHQVFEVIYLCMVILWGFWKQEDCLFSIAAVGLFTLIDFPLSAVPALLLALLYAAGRKSGREMPRQDIALCFLYVLSAMGFYGGIRPEFWILWLFLLLSAFVYVLFYRGKYLWSVCAAAFAILPLPLVLSTRYQITGDQLYGFVAGALLATGIISRLIVPVIRRREGDGRWQIDFYHIVCIVPLLFMTFWADRYWRFAYVLLLALYCIQYMMVKGFDGFERVRRLSFTGAGFCLLSAFWLQPFVIWPEAAQLEINVLAAAVFVWALVLIWGKSQSLRDAQTVGYLLCLVVLVVDAAHTGKAEDGLILEGICLTILVCAQIKSNARWQYLSAIVMFGFAAVDFYRGSCLGLLGTGLLIGTFWLSYLVFYHGKYAGFCIHFLSSLVMLPVPLTLSGRYGITGDQLYGSVAICLLATGAAARSIVPIAAVKREEDRPIQWRIDFYHSICVVPLLIMTFWADKYWRFAYLLVLSLYCIQYVTMKGFEGAEKLHRLSVTGAAVCLLSAFWLQPFITWPEVAELEISLFPAAVFLWSMALIWGKSKTLWDIQTAGYVLILGILSADGIRTGRVEDALMLGGVCLLSFVWALVKSCTRWVRISGALIVAEALYMTKDFWFNLSWWVYLLAAGVGLLVFAAVSEKKRK